MQSCLVAEDRGIGSPPSQLPRLLLKCKGLEREAETQLPKPSVYCKFVIKTSATKAWRSELLEPGAGRAAGRSGQTEEPLVFVP